MIGQTPRVTNPGELDFQQFVLELCSTARSPMWSTVQVIYSGSSFMWRWKDSDKPVWRRWQSQKSFTIMIRRICERLHVLDTAGVEKAVMCLKTSQNNLQQIRTLVDSIKDTNQGG